MLSKHIYTLLWPKGIIILPPFRSTFPLSSNHFPLILHIFPSLGNWILIVHQSTLLGSQILYFVPKRWVWANFSEGISRAFSVMSFLGPHSFINLPSYESFSRWYVLVTFTIILVCEGPISKKDPIATVLVDLVFPVIPVSTGLLTFSNCLIFYLLPSFKLLPHKSALVKV